MRLFVAFDLSENVRDRIAALLRELNGETPGVKWVAAEAIHITLKFIGELAEDRLPQLGDALAAVPSPGPLELSFRGLGCFPNERRPRVFWAGVEAPPELARLAGDVERAVEALGVEREQRSFKPHLTLGRAREGGRPVALGQAWQKHRADEFGKLTAAEFFLYQSRLSPHGAEYTRLRRFPL